MVAILKRLPKAADHVRSRDAEMGMMRAPHRDDLVREIRRIMEEGEVDPLPAVRISALLAKFDQERGVRGQSAGSGLEDDPLLYVAAPEAAAEETLDFLNSRLLGGVAALPTVRDRLATDGVQNADLDALQDADSVWRTVLQRCFEKLRDAPNLYNAACQTYRAKRKTPPQNEAERRFLHRALEALRDCVHRHFTSKGA